jgi:hypothetical protein
MSATLVHKAMMMIRTDFLDMVPPEELIACRTAQASVLQSRQCGESYSSDSIDLSFSRSSRT